MAFCLGELIKGHVGAAPNKGVNRTAEADFSCFFGEFGGARYARRYALQDLDRCSTTLVAGAGSFTLCKQILE